jgi:hypothetical protein
LTEACWDWFFSNKGDPFTIFGNLVTEVIRWARTERAHECSRVDAESEEAVLAMETLARSINKAVERGDDAILEPVESWVDIEPWWTEDPRLPKPIRNAVKSARVKILSLLQMILPDLPLQLRRRMDEAVERAYRDVVVHMWWQDNPGPRAMYAYGYTD